MRTGERREPLCRMDFNRIVNVARTPDPDYGVSTAERYAEQGNPMSATGVNPGLRRC